MAPHLEPEALEHLYPVETVSDGYAQGGPQLDPDTGMGSKPRSEGCIPTHPYQTRPLEVPSIPIPGHPVRIHSTPIRPFHLSSRVHTSSEGGWGCTENARSDDIHVSRRLAHCGQVSRSHHGRTELHVAHNQGPRFIINTEKSRPCPTQFPIFLGASLNLQKGLACPTEARILNLHQCVSLFLPSSVAPARAWLKLLGLMASLVDIVDFCRLRICPIQLHLLSHYQPRRHHIDYLVPTTPWLRPHLRWWLDPTNLIRGHAFRRPRPSVVITTDASLSGWGATLHLHQVAGRWEPEHRTSHVNILEMLAVLKALHFSTPRLQASRCWFDATTLQS